MAKRPPVIVFSWDGDAMVPHRAYRPLANRLFVVGEDYRLEPREDRDMKSHRGFFADVTAMWKALPEPFDEKYPDPEALRHDALCHTGWCETQPYVLTTNKAAMEMAKMLRKTAPYAVMSISDNVLVVKVALSQAVNAMGKEDFQKSKRDVLDWIERTTGVSLADIHLAHRANRERPARQINDDHHR